LAERAETRGGERAPLCCDFVARPIKEAPIVSAIVPSIAKLLRARGHDVDSLALRFALPEDAESRESVLCAENVPNELLEILEHDAPALALCEALAGSLHTLADVAFRSSATVADALAVQARTTSLLHEGLLASVEGARFVVKTPRRPRGVGRHVHELAIALALHRLRRSTEERVVPRAVWFAHARPRDVVALAEFFGGLRETMIEFGREDSGFELADPIPSMKHADAQTAEAMAHMLAERIEPRTTFTARVAGLVAESLPKELDAAALADALHMSPRTLQRRLEGEGTALTDVVARARREVAERLLSDASLPLAEVAARCGFSELATFSRAFKRWTGKPPGQWRRS
jgi:AraC-like DNA-binding protein